MSTLKTKTNFIIDILMFLCLAAITGMGLMMKFILIPGQDRWAVYGKNVELYVLNLERHQWGTVHLIVSLCMLALLAVHIILHWKAVILQFKSWTTSKIIRRILTILFIVICFILVFFPSRIKPRIEDFEGGRGRFYQERRTVETPTPVEEAPTPEQATTRDVVPEEPEIRKTETDPETPVDIEEQEEHEHDATIDVQGFMTLKEMENNYQVPVDHLKSKLEIPESVSENERLGRLRRTYGFTMSDVRDIIIEYKSNKK
jgi:hypothetical protein